MRKLQPRWILVVLLFFGLGINMIHRTSLSIAGPAILRDFSLNTAQMGWLLSAFFWPYAVLQIPAGWLVDRLGARKLYSVSFAIWSVACALMAAASGFWSLLVVRVVLGVGQAAIFPASIHVIASSFTDKQRATAVALFSTGSRFGLIVLPVTGAWLISNWGWRVFFLVIGLAPMIWLVAWHKFFVRFPEQTSLNNSPAVVRTTSKQGQSPSMRGLLRNRNVWGICLGYFAYDYVWYLYIAWLPGYLMLERGYALAQTGVYAAFPMAAMSIVIPSAGSRKRLASPSWLLGNSGQKNLPVSWFATGVRDGAGRSRCSRFRFRFVVNIRARWSRPCGSEYVGANNEAFPSRFGGNVKRRAELCGQYWRRPCTAHHRVHCTYHWFICSCSRLRERRFVLWSIGLSVSVSCSGLYSTFCAIPICPQFSCWNLIRRSATG